jgi:psp operon transcriptional activator
VSGQGFVAPPSTVPDKPANDAAPTVPQTIPGDFRARVHAYEKGLLEEALKRHRHNQRATAKALGLTYDQLRHCLRKHGLLEVAA